MADQTAGQYGGFEYRGRAYLFDEASGSFEPGELFLEARGKRCELRLVGVPFPGILSAQELPGHVWEPGEAELALHADVFAEGGLRVKDRDLWIMGGRIECRRFDLDRSALVVKFRLQVQDESGERQNEADGTVSLIIE